MANKQNLVIDQGTVFSSNLILTDQNGDNLNLIGFTANSMMRRWYTSKNSVSFSTSINVISATINLSLTPNTTSTLIPGRYVYDVNISNGNNIIRVVEGIITVTPTATK